MIIAFYSITKSQQNQYSNWTKSGDVVDMETIIMELIVNSGNARSRAMEAIRAANNGELEKVKEKIKESEEDLGKAQ